MGKHRHRLCALQPRQGRADAERGRHDAAQTPAPTDDVRVAGSWSRVPAQSPPRELAGLSVLGHRTGSLTAQNGTSLFTGAVGGASSAGALTGVGGFSCDDVRMSSMFPDGLDGLDCKA